MSENSKTAANLKGQLSKFSGIISKSCKKPKQKLIKEMLYGWMVPVSLLVLLVPFFYVSWFFERHRAKRLHQDCLPESVNRATLKANIYSYGLLGIIIVVGWLIAAITNKSHT